jgi:hypothetical protein
LRCMHLATASDLSFVTLSRGFAIRHAIEYFALLK